METILRIAVIAFAGGIASVILKNSRPEFAFLTVMATTIVILSIALSGAVYVIDSIMRVSQRTGLSSEYIFFVVKITGLAYITEYVSSMLKDAGETALATQTEFAGKILIFAVSMPVVMSVFEMLVSFF